MILTLNKKKIKFDLSLKSEEDNKKDYYIKLELTDKVEDSVLL